MQMGMVAWVASVTVAAPVASPLMSIPSPSMATVTPAAQLVLTPMTASDSQVPAAPLFGAIELTVVWELTETRKAVREVGDISAFHIAAVTR